MRDMADNCLESERGTCKAEHKTFTNIIVRNFNMPSSTKNQIRQTFGLPNFTFFTFPHLSFTFFAYLCKVFT